MGTIKILLYCFIVFYPNMRCFLVLLLLVAHTKGNQLDKLINFAKGSGPNPSGATRSSSQHSAASPQRSIPGRAQNKHASPRRPTATVASPIPFAELADPSRGQVQLDVPQPKYVGPIPEQSQTIIGAHTSQQVIAASTPPPFKGLPAGATQVGGNPVRIAPVKPTKPKPVPLSQINPPIYLSETFPSSLNTIDPARAPLQEPVEALQHRFQPGTRPQPLPVQNQDLAGLMALKNNERRAQSQNFNYNRIVGEIFNKWNKLSYYNSEDLNINTYHNITCNSPNIITYHNIKYNNHSKCIETLALFNQLMDRILPSQHLIKQSNMKMN